MSWLDPFGDRVNDLLVALERIAAALERIADAAQATSSTDPQPGPDGEYDIPGAGQAGC